MGRVAAIFAAGALALAAGVGLAWWWTNADFSPLPAFALQDTSGDLRHAREWRGQVLVLNFWATWCKPCRKEVPLLVRAQKEMGDQGLQVVGLAIDEVAAVRRFAQQYDINYPLLVDAMGVVKLQDALGGGPGIPYTVVVDRRGRIRHQVVGVIEQGQLEAMVGPLLDEVGP